MKTQNKSAWHISDEDMLLYCTEELSVDMKIQADEHLQDCKLCQKACIETRDAVAQFKVIKTKQASHSTLTQAHHKLMQQVYQGDVGSRHKNIRKQVATWMAIAASLIVGFFAGRTSIHTNDSNGYETLLTAYQMMEYGAVQVDSETQEVSITLPKVENQVLKGSMDDSDMQQMVQAILKYDVRDNVRSKVLKMIDSDMLLVNQDLSSAVIYVLEHDTNPGLRLRAMRLLKRLPASPGLIAVLKRILMKDEIEGIHVQAAQYLAAENYELHSAFIKQIARENDYMRSLVLRAEMPLS